GCEDAGWRGSNENFCGDDIVVWSDARGGHLFPRFKSFASFYESFQPAKRCAPAGIMTLGLINVAGEPGMANANQRSGADFMRSSGVQSMNFVRFELPANHGGEGTDEIGDASVDQQARRINLKVFAFKMKMLAIATNTFVRPFSAH